MQDRMPAVPADVKEYKRTPVFDDASVPAALVHRHSLKAGVWGEIVVVEGEVVYVIESDPPAQFLLRPTASGTIEPEQLHHVEPRAGARFFVRFLRRPTGP